MMILPWLTSRSYRKIVAAVADALLLRPWFADIIPILRSAGLPVNPTKIIGAKFFFFPEESGRLPVFWAGKVDFLCYKKHREENTLELISNAGVFGGDQCIFRFRTNTRVWNYAELDEGQIIKEWPGRLVIT